MNTTENNTDYTIAQFEESLNTVRPNLYEELISYLSREGELDVDEIYYQAGYGNRGYSNNRINFVVTHNKKTYDFEVYYLRDGLEKVSIRSLRKERILC